MTLQNARAPQGHGGAASAEPSQGSNLNLGEVPGGRREGAPRRVLDLFCCAGGAAMGLKRAWPDAEITGVDIRPQPHYPFNFVQADAMTFPLEGFDFIWASPPCQAYSRMHKLNLAQGVAKEHPRLIEPVRARLEASGIPYCIENVEGAPLRSAFTLCGSMFGLLVQRHRLFETSYFTLVPECRHELFVADKPPLHRLQGVSRVVGCYGNGRGKGDDIALWKRAMGIDWMSRKELAQAIPPAYSEFIARQFNVALAEGPEASEGSPPSPPPSPMKGI